MQGKNLRFGTKAETLKALQQVVQSAKVLPLCLFHVKQWSADPESVTTRIQAQFSNTRVIVRSSARDEDGSAQSHAGAFRSVGHILSSDTTALAAAIDEVIASYGQRTFNDQFFVQAQLEDVAASGVVFTRDLDTNAPYLTINYDLSGSTESVTSGTGENLQTYVRFRGSSLKPTDPIVAQVLEAVKELEHIFATDRLDLEFAVTKSSDLYILQARPLTGNSSGFITNDEEFKHYLLKIQDKIATLNAPHPGLHGKSAIYSVMTDWNPAEIIGTKPKTLALSLYKELVTDSIWAYQRNNYGYKNLRSFPLVISFLGLPYIDVRASFNSFVPKDLDSKLSEKLVDYYIDRLKATPTEHDKAEFKIIFSCYYLNLPEKLQVLSEYGFSDRELDRIKFSLLTITNSIISSDHGLYKKDLHRVETLKSRFEGIVSSSLPITDKIYWLIEDCKRYGTLPFAGLARAGFIAVQFMQSFVELGIMSSTEYHQALHSLNTVTRELGSHLAMVANGELTREEFLQRYGHLRPGTYDIQSPRYDEQFDEYFRSLESIRPPHVEEHFEFSKAQRDLIAEQLRQNGIVVSVDELLTFIKEGIEGREYGKFVFTKSLSQVLLLLESLGTELGLTREEMSHIDIRRIIDHYARVSRRDLGEILHQDLLVNQEDYELTKVIRLPQVITSPDNVTDFYVGDVEPNFVTLSRVTQVVILEEDLLDSDLSDSIVCITSADPGYDWIFSRNIAGLVTMYGGANSHMAIRCAELKIPAVIGCGEQNFKIWSAGQVLDIDCANRKVRVVS